MGATPKQIAFAGRVVSGMAPSAAYRDTYDATGMSPASIAKEASRLMRNPHIAPMIEEGVRSAMENASWCRMTAIESLEKVNQRCLESLVSSDGAVDRSALQGFLETCDRLNKLTNVESEVKEDFDSRFRTTEKIKERAARDQLEANASFEAFGVSLSK